MYQIIFNNASAAEMAALPKPLQLEIVSEFNFLPDDLESAVAKGLLGTLERGGRRLYRLRAKDYRVYFEKTDNGLTIHRVLSKNTLTDFFFRSKFPLAEDEALQKLPEFWELIDQQKR